MKNILLGKPRPRRAEMTAIIQKTVAPISRRERIPFYEAGGRICAQNIYSRNTLPNSPVSRLDGIAVRYDDFKNGLPHTANWVLGREYAYCNTGIALPEGYDTVIAIEDITLTDEGLSIQVQPAHEGQRVKNTGSDMRQGELLLKKGEVIAPAHIGLLASGGILELEVAAKPRLAVIPTGDELVAPISPVPEGKNVDSNSYMIAAYLNQWGAEPMAFPIIPDDPDALAAALKKALTECDAAIIIAGSSLGTKDYTLRVLHTLGEIIVPELAYGPGRKSSLSVVNGKPVLGIAGPPLGAQITCDLYLSPFVSALRGLPPVALRQLEVISDDAFQPHEVDFCERVHIYNCGGSYRIRAAFAPVTTRGQMQALANGNFYRPAGSFCEPGSKTRVELLCPVEYLPNRDLLPEILAALEEDGEEK